MTYTETAREDRERAILALAAPGRMRIDAADVEALSDQLEDPRADLARSLTVTMETTRRWNA